MDNILRIGYKSPEFYCGKAAIILSRQDDITIEYVDSHFFEINKNFVSMQNIAENVVLALKHLGLKEISRNKIKREAEIKDCLHCSHFHRNKKIKDKQVIVLDTGNCDDKNEEKHKNDNICLNFKPKISTSNIIKLEKIQPLKDIREQIKDGNI